MSKGTVNVLTRSAGLLVLLAVTGLLLNSVPGLMAAKPAAGDPGAAPVGTCPMYIDVNENGQCDHADITCHNILCPRYRPMVIPDGAIGTPVPESLPEGDAAIGVTIEPRAVAVVPAANEDTSAQQAVGHCSSCGACGGASGGKHRGRMRMKMRMKMKMRMMEQSGECGGCLVND